MARNLVICCDGTWNTPTQTDRGVVVPSNVFRMKELALERDHQLVYYDPGVGTEEGLDHWTGGSLGIGLTDNIKQAYARIAAEYQPGDRIFLFGFSRGAYTVRSLGGLMGRCGLVHDLADVDQAYELYRKAGNEAGRSAAREFKARQRTIDIHFLGVWDTVGALGVPAISKYGLLRKSVRLITDNTKWAHGFHDETLGRHVLHAYQALAIDERRGPFEPSVWKTVEGDAARPTVEQVWFAGVHSNIGGGYLDSGLSDHAFMWMATKAMGAGLVLDARRLTDIVKPNALGEMRDEYHGVYKWMASHERKIGSADTLNEKIHASVVERLQGLAGAYRPANLISIDPKPPPTGEGVDKLGELRAMHAGDLGVGTTPA